MGVIRTVDSAWEVATWGATSFVGDVVTGMLRRFYRRHSGFDDRRAGVRWFVSVHRLYRERTCRPTSRPSTEPPFLTNAFSRKKAHGLDVNSIYTVKTRFEHCPRRRRARPSKSRRAFRQGHHLIAEGGRRLGGASQITAAAEPLSLHR